MLYDINNSQNTLTTFQSLQEDYNRTPAQRLLKEIQEAKKHIPQLQEQLSKATGSAQVAALLKSNQIFVEKFSCRNVSENAAVIFSK